MITPTDISLSPSYKYPVEITAIVQPAGASIEKHSTLLRFKYHDFVQEENGAIEGSEQNANLPQRVEKEFFSTFESPINGTIEEWLVKRGDIINGPKMTIVRIVEPCTHSVQYGGLCALCGASLDEDDYTEFKNTDRAPISMSHNTTGLKVSFDEAQRIEKTSTQQLLCNRKLILVVDLDQTVIHAAVDPTIGEWMRDINNPNHQSLQDVKTFTLEESLPEHQHQPNRGPVNNYLATTKCCYYVKLRPGLDEFLKRMAQLYEMHIYTMATKAYAKAIAQLIDPEGRYFADRILSRDESGSLLQKNLHRLFPVSTNMVAIIDDRADVWKWSSHLVKVNPFNFFMGIGDINSGMPAQRLKITGPSLQNGSKEGSRQPADMMPNESPNPKHDEQGKALSGEAAVTNGTKESIQDIEQEEEHEQEEEDHQRDLEELGPDAENEILAGERSANLEAQQVERPLAKLQQQINEQHSSQHVLNDQDSELPHLAEILESVHSEFYKEYDEQSNEQKKKQKEQEQKLPDLSVIIPKIKRPVFEGCVFLFSGIIPLGHNFENTTIVQWVRSFGAVVVANLVDSVTHVIARSGGTMKVRYAAWRPDVKVVHLDWVYACLQQWRRVPEDEYLIYVDNPLPPPDSGIEIEQNADDLISMHEGGERFRKSIGQINWADADKELEEFMGSDSDEEEEEGNEDEDDMDGERRDRKRGRESDDDMTNKRTKYEESDFDDAEFAKELLEGLIE